MGNFEDHKRQGRRLEQAREAKGFKSAAEAAKKLKLPSVTTYQHHENGTRGMQRSVGQYAKAYGVTEEWLLYGRNPPPWADTGVDANDGAPIAIPIIDAVTAGRLADPVSQIEGEHQTIEISGLPPGDFFATRVAGDSMNRISPEGSLILVNRAEREPLPGRRYVFGRRGKTTYKRFEKDPIRLVPESTNPEHEAIFPKSEEEWTVIGRVRLTLLDDL